jgi:hypothetical protein
MEARLEMPPTLLDHIFHQTGLLSAAETLELCKYVWEQLTEEQQSEFIAWADAGED